MTQRAKRVMELTVGSAKYKTGACCLPLNSRSISLRVFKSVPEKLRFTGVNRLGNGYRSIQ
jgi:hypothetical protein